MYFLLSPAKNLNETIDIQDKTYSQPQLLEQAAMLMQALRSLSTQQLAELMQVSDKIAHLNTKRNQDWQPPFTPKNAKPALYLFNGDVYEGINAYQLNIDEIDYIQNHVRILSGLYGILQPLDLIQAYRLEMGTTLKNPKGENLYEFWGNLITEKLNTTIQTSKTNYIINLASQEYFKVIKPSKLHAQIITPIFQDEKNGKYKVISFYAKRARGLMVRYAAQNAIENIEQLQKFNLEGYNFIASDSTENEWIFRRHQ